MGSKSSTTEEIDMTEESAMEYKWCVHDARRHCIKADELEKILLNTRSGQVTQAIDKLCEDCQYKNRLKMATRQLIKRQLQRPLAPEVKELLWLIKPYGFIAGSCARYFASLVKDEPIYNDVDIFCNQEHDFNDVCYIALGNGWKLKKESPNAVQFTKTFNGIEAVAEVIKPFKNDYMQTYGQPEEVVGQFDFPCVKTWFVSETELYIDEQFDQDTKDRKLHITHINCPVAVAQRVAKYAQKGYTIGVREIMKLFVEWERRPALYRQRLLELLHENQDLTDEEFAELERLLRVD